MKQTIQYYDKDWYYVKDTDVSVAVYKSVSNFNDKGYLRDIAYFDMNDKPILYKDGYHKKVLNYNEFGNQILKTLFDVYGDNMDRSDNKMFEHMSYYDSNWYLLADEEGASYKSKHYTDKERKEILEAFFDMEDQPILSRDGYHKRIPMFNSMGDRVAVTYLDIDGNQVL
jgi:hypothetical protein